MTATIPTATESVTIDFSEGIALPAQFPTGEYAIQVVSTGYLGWSVSFRCNKTDASGKMIMLPPTVVTKDIDTLGVTCTLPSGFDAVITVSAMQNGAPPAAPGAQLTLQAYYTVPSQNAKAAERTTLVLAAGPTYDGFYFRNNLQSNGDVPSTGPYNVTPDIVGSSEPIPDAQSKLATPASWKTSYDTDPVPGAANYYYVRGLNGATTAVSSAPVSLYYAPAELILWPSTWKNHPLHTASGRDTVTVSAQPGAIGVGSEAFVWRASPLSGDSDFYALVAQAAPAIPAVNRWTDMGALLTQDLGFGFRNTVYVNGSAQAWTHRLGLNIPASFDAPGQIMLTLTTAGMSGATIGVLANVFGSDQKVIAILPAQVTQDSFATGIQVTLEPGFSASLAVQYWSGGATPAAGSTITLTASYVLPPSEVLTAATRGLIDSAHDRFLQSVHAGIQPQATVLLGSATFIVGP